MDNSDDRNILWGILSFIFSIVGIILGAVWWKNRNTNAKVCLYSALGGFGIFIMQRIVSHLAGYHIFISMFLELALFVAGLVAVIMWAKKVNEEQ